MLRRQARASMIKTKDCDQTFILFGKSNSGKSALGNLLLGPHATTHFSVHPRPEPSGHTKKMQSGESEIDAKIVYGEGYTGHNRVKIQIIDQPGCNDNDYLISSNQCLEESKTEKNITCLIVIDLSAKFFSEEEFTTIMKFSETLSKSQYCVFPNAIIVFTHADMLDRYLGKETLEEILHEKLELEDYGYIRELLDLVEDKYVFVNAVNYGEMNKNAIIKKLFKQTRPNLNVYMNGNYYFKGRELKMLLGEDADADSIEENLPMHDVEYHFSPDLKRMGRYDIKSMKKEIIDVLDKLSGISNGISAIPILINLEEKFDDEIYNHIINLPNTYNLGDKSKHHFWDYACIVFKARMDSKAFVRRQIEANPKLKNLDRMVQSRYCWITNRSIPEECYERLGDLVKEVTSYNKLKTYTDSTVVTEMSRKIQKCFAAKYSNDRRASPEVERGWLLPEDDVLCQQLSPRNALLSIDHRFWVTEHTGISTLIGYFIWKNINTDIANGFRKRFSNAVISTDAFIDFCLEFKW